MARSLFKTLDSIATPCSVKTIGVYFIFFPLIKVTICDCHISVSFLVSRNMKSIGKRFIFLVILLLIPLFS
jgi:hypothetical protein